MVTWQLINNGLNNEQAINVFQLLADDDTLFAATADGIYKSIDNGNKWIKKSDGIFVGNGTIYEYTLSIFKHKNVLFTGAFTGIYKSTDGGENWIVTNVSDHHIYPVLFVNHNGILFAARDAGASPSGYVSTNNGLSWQELSIRWPTITFLSEGEKLWAGTIHGVWLSTDNGTTWEQRSNGLNSDPYNSTIIRVNGALITSLKFGGFGVFRSTDEGMNWENYGGGFESVDIIEKLVIYGDELIAVTNSGLWKRDITTQLESNEDNIPQNHILYTNYPNPFNPSTTISYTIGGDKVENVLLRIYNSIGREITTLVNKSQLPGTYKIDFAGKNLPSGIYFYELLTENQRIAKKMVLIK